MSYVFRRDAFAPVVGFGLSAPRVKRNQIRRKSGLGGPEEGIAISEIWRCVVLLSKSPLEMSSVETNDMDADGLAVKSASGE
jgi:hypothetical protein